MSAADTGAPAGYSGLALNFERGLIGEERESLESLQLWLRFLDNHNRFWQTFFLNEKPYPSSIFGYSQSPVSSNDSGLHWYPSGCGSGLAIRPFDLEQDTAEETPAFLLAYQTIISRLPAKFSDWIRRFEQTRDL